MVEIWRRKLFTMPFEILLKHHFKSCIIFCPVHYLLVLSVVFIITIIIIIILIFIFILPSEPTGSGSLCELSKIIYLPKWHKMAIRCSDHRSFLFASLQYIYKHKAFLFICLVSKHLFSVHVLVIQIYKDG